MVLGIKKKPILLNHYLKTTVWTDTISVLKSWALLGLILSYLRTPTSFLKACSCCGVGAVTFNIFTATSPEEEEDTHLAFSVHSLLIRRPKLFHRTYRATSPCRLFQKSQILSAVPGWSDLLGSPNHRSSPVDPGFSKY